MILIKKLAFTPLLVISFLILLYFFNPILKSINLIFSLDLSTLYQLITLSILILISSLIFVLISSLTADLKLIIPVIILVSALPFVLIETKLAIILAAIVFISLLLTFVSLETKLKGYLTFNATDLLSPSIKQLAGLLIFGLCLIYYLSINNVIGQQGFQIPDSLIDAALKFSPQATLPVQGFKYDKRLVAQLPQLTPEQLELLKKNPQLLKQYGIDPKTLDNISLPTPAKTIQLSTTSSNTPANMNDFLKQTVKDQVQGLIKPYQDFIPAVLALLLFFTLQSLLAVLSLFLTPLIWLIFFILEKTNYIHYEIEMREAKKMVV